MAVYSVVLPDSTILKRVSGLKSALIVGCGACLNDSLAFSTDRPLAQVIIDRNTGKTDILPMLIDKELQRIKTLLENNGIRTGTESTIPICEISFVTEPFISNLSKRSGEAEAIISVSCSVGTLALKKQLGKIFKIISATKTSGIFQVTKSLDESGKFVYLDKNQSTILKFKTQ
jgi:hypothetical protein